MVKGLFVMNHDIFDLVYPTEVRRGIEQFAEIYAPLLNEEEVRQDLSVLHNAEVIFSGWGGPELNKEFLEAAPNLKAVFYAAGSIKKIATEESWRRDIIITNAVQANAMPVAEFTLSQILFCLKNGWSFVREVQKEKSFPQKPYAVPGGYKSSVGIISLSTVGQSVCELLKNFDVDVFAYDPFIDKNIAKRLGVKLCSLDDIFEISDVISLHTPLLENTQRMIKGKHFERMKPNASFINTARGALIKEKEMIDVLKKRPDITAVLDVTHPEPPEQDSPLYTMPNVILTPHLAGSQGAECGRMGAYMFEEFQRYLNGDPLMWQVRRKDFGIMA